MSAAPFIATGPNCDGPAFMDPDTGRRTDCPGCPEGGPPMELTRVIYACNCQCTHEEDAPELFQRAPAMLAALRGLPDDVELIEHNPDEGATFVCCGAPVRYATPSAPEPARPHAPGCWYIAARAVIAGLE